MWAVRLDGTPRATHHGRNAHPVEEIKSEARRINPPDSGQNTAVYMVQRRRVGLLRWMRRTAKCSGKTAVGAISPHSGCYAEDRIYFFDYHRLWRGRSAGQRPHLNPWRKKQRLPPGFMASPGGCRKKALILRTEGRVCKQVEK